jgi:hypothetical protein
MMTGCVTIVGTLVLSGDLEVKLEHSSLASHYYLVFRTPGNPWNYVTINISEPTARSLYKAVTQSRREGLLSIEDEVSSDSLTSTETN